MSNKKNTDNSKPLKPSRSKDQNATFIVNRRKRDVFANSDNTSSKKPSDTEITQMHSTPPKPGSDSDKGK
ncbi:hypothetical protein NI390_17895 [Vibrio fluvialis]|uniref:hypothetical protein n=1 Tax=Vibrio fluvialis TaxID=676 RepID=UPI0027E58296|nr:hypothetical protein [Vibrio fluvialis]WMN58154.1 hypothetical protein NI390_17895 [Vibrio fluvialis]